MTTSSRRFVPTKSPKLPLKQPLSAYNLFFQICRKSIITETKMVITAEHVRLVNLERKNRPKRPHRKSHGKIGFRELARKIAAKWKCIGQEERRILDEQAALEKQDYMIRLRAWKDQQARLEARTHGHEDPLSLSSSARRTTSFDETPSPEEEESKEDSSLVSNAPNPLHQTLQELRDQIQALMTEESTSRMSPELSSSSRSLDAYRVSENEGIASMPQESSGEQGQECSNVNQNSEDQDVEELLWENTLCSPTFIEAAGDEGVDLFQPMDSQEMEAIFDDGYGG